MNRLNASTSDAHKEMLAQVAAIITALAETNGSPESMLYVFVGMDINKWERMRYVLTSGVKPLVTIRSNYVTLTSHGKLTADRINAAIAGAPRR